MTATLPIPDQAETDLTHCLTPLLHALNWSGDNQKLQEAMPYPSGKMDLIGLLNTMANLKFGSKIMTSRLDRVHEKVFPCLFADENNCLKIFLSKEGDNYLIYDASTREYREFAAREPLQGQFIRFQSMKGEDSSLLKPQNEWFLKLFTGFKKTIWLCFFISLLISLLSFCTPLIIMFVFDQIQVQHSNMRLIMVSIGVLGFLLCDLVFHALRDTCTQYLGARIGNLVGNQLIRRILYLPPHMTRGATVSSQITRIKELENIRDFFAGPALNSLFDLVLVVVLLVGMAFIGGNLAYIPMCGILVFLLFGGLLRSLIKKLSNDSSFNASNMQELLMEMLVQIKFIKVSGATRSWHERVRKISEQSSLNALDSLGVNNFVGSFSNFVVGVSGLTTMYFGVIMASKNEISTGTLMAVLLLTWRILSPMKSCFTVIANFEDFLRGMRKINKMMAFALEGKSGEEQSLQNKFKGDISFNRVTLKYENSQNPSLNGVTFRMRKGDTLLICGHAGSGRSSILKLLIRMIEFQGGEITIDDMNIRQVDPMLLRWSMAYTAPMTHFFDGTLRENLLFANPGASEDLLQKALLHADLHEEVKALPRGLESAVNQRTLDQYSESFKKRFGFAQTFLRNAPILLFDKPDFGLSQERIETFIKLLNRHYRKTTRIIVSNKRDFFRMADHVIWMEEGRVRMFNSAKVVEEKFYGDKK